jgi:hypothetical protein
MSVKLKISSSANEASKKTTKKGSTLADPKPERGAAPSWLKRKPSPELKSAAESFASKKGATFKAHCRLGAAIATERSDITNEKAIQPDDIRFYLAHVLFPLCATCIDSSLEGVTFRKARKGDSDETRKALQRWQSTVSHIEHDGVIVSRLKVQKVIVANDFDAGMGVGKLRYIWAILNKTMTAKGLKLSERSDNGAIGSTLLNIYKKALKFNVGKLSEWNADCKAAKKGTVVKAPNGKGNRVKGTRHVYTKHSAVIRDVYKELYTKEEMAEMQDAMIEVTKRITARERTAKKIRGKKTVSE